MTKFMARPLRWTILVHRYLGIALSLLLVVWFLSGIAMIYAGGMPTLTADARLEHMLPVDFDRILLSPAEAAARAGLRSPGRALLLTVLDRPAYQFGGAPAIVFADTGDSLRWVG